MIISDLKYLEDATQEIFGGSDKLTFTKTLTSKVTGKLDLDYDIDKNKDIKVDIHIDAKSKVKGHIASAIWDLEAQGPNGLTEMDLVAFTSTKKKLSYLGGEAIASSN